MSEENNKENNIASTQLINTENLEKINKLKNLLQSENSDLFEIMSLKDQITFEDQNEEDQINNNIWQKQYISVFPESSNDTSLLTKINLNMINLLLSTANKYKIKDEEKLNKIKNIHEEANNFIKEIKKTKTLEELNNLKQNSDKIKIDLDEYFIQREMKLKNKIDNGSDEEDINKQKNNAENTNTKNKESNKTKSHRRKRYKRKEDEYENDFVEDGSEGSEDDSEKIDLSNHVIDLGKKKSGNNIKRIADE